MKMQKHISSLVLCGKQRHRNRRVDATIAAYKDIVSRLERRQLAVVQIVISITAHCEVRSEGLFLSCNVSDEKKFSALQNNLHRKETTLWQRLLLHRCATFLESKVVEETLE